MEVGDVLVEVGLGPEHDGAVGTGVPHPVRHDHVLVQVGPLVEPGSTNCTLESLVCSVEHHMLVQICGSQKLLATDLASAHGAAIKQRITNRILDLESKDLLHA